MDASEQVHLVNYGSNDDHKGFPGLELMFFISYLVEWNVAQVCMVRLVPVGENETKIGRRNPLTLPGGHQHQGQAVD